VNWVEENRSRGSIGARARRSQTTNAASSATPAASAVTTAGLPHPLAGPSISPYVSPTSPRVTSAPPAMSTRPVASGSWDSGTCRTASTTTAAAIGRLITKISRQVPAGTSHPLRNGPIAVATPASPDQAPIALPRSSGANDASRIARLARSQQRGTDALQRPRGDEDARARNQAAQHRSRREPDYPDEKDPFPSVPVSQRAGDQLQTGQSEQVRGDHPLQCGQAGVSAPMVGSAMPTTVASIEAMAEPRTVAASAHRPGPLA
jgi:hypothetical protein